MKNIGQIVMVSAVLMLFAIQAQSQSSISPVQQADQQEITTSPSRESFVDKNNNGICDNFESRSGIRRGGNFVDKNNDGICDNRAQNGRKAANANRNGSGNHYRHGQHYGCGNGYGSRR